MAGCGYAFCDLPGLYAVEGIGMFCPDHAREAVRVAKLRDHGLRARSTETATADSRGVVSDYRSVSEVAQLTFGEN